MFYLQNALNTVLSELDLVVEASCTSQDTVATLKALSLDQSNQPKRYVAEITVSANRNTVRQNIFKLTLKPIIHTAYK